MMTEKRSRIASDFTLLVVSIAALYLCVTPVSSLSEHYRRQIQASKEDINKILNHILRGEGKHQTYNRLAELGDRFGHRTSGSASLERAIDYSIEHMRNISLDAVRKEPVTVPHWERGKEWAELTVPAYGWTRPMFIMAFGTSIGTGGQNVTAEGIVVNSYEELQTLDGAAVQGKIVVFNAPRVWTRYDTTYRSNGAIWAAEKGAVAALVRSVTGHSIYSPHTGAMNTASVPGAAVTLEDAELMQRLHDRNIAFSITINMEARNFADSESFNAVGEITGSIFPNESVIIGGHIDTWDVTDGSMDDGGGVMMAWEAVTLIKHLGLKPKRSIRLVLWTSEEFGFYGANEYYARHNAIDLNTTSLAMQADGGSFYPYGIRFTGSNTAREIMQEIMSMLEEINTTQICPGSGRSSDTGIWVDNGVPGVELCNANENYFDYHHTLGDAMTVLDEEDLDKCTAIWAAVSYAVANMDDLLPREDDAVSTTPSISKATESLCATHHVLLLSIIASAFFHSIL